MNSVEVDDLKSQIRQLIAIIEILKKELPALSQLIDRWLEEFKEKPNETV